MLQCVRIAVILAMGTTGGSFTPFHSVHGAGERKIELSGVPGRDTVLQHSDSVPAFRRHSVSGFSAGASVAINHLVAFSGVVDGVGVIGASPCVAFIVIGFVVFVTKNCFLAREFYKSLSLSMILVFLATEFQIAHCSPPTLARVRSCEPSLCHKTCGIISSPTRGLQVWMHRIARRW